ncbi:hypothetical protein SAMN04488540_10214 [Ferrimonas sediminum]|uniref:Porin n=1 Tax=Ferrimonas sediminum TaxID=718193 RepID=A0A1G8LBJ5_9GAMM|nr:hypothetical protein [Ferrimonas sediminum]SDI53015.1 hypothetical protein SAMN04488540_10214 [Ferrimonas sediminum]
MIRGLHHWMPILLTLFAAAPVHANDPEWEDDWGEEWGEEATSPWQPLSGFVEAGFGRRLQTDEAGLGSTTLSQLTARMESGYQGEQFQASVRLDAGYDDVVDGWLMDVRELSVSTAIGDNTQLKAGRQVLTWGTGDYLFLNDLFPKDWQAFFSGQEDEYLKAPVNAIKTSWYGSRLNADLVYMPRFEADNSINGERFSYYDPINGGKVAPGYSPNEPSDDAAAARLFWSSGQMEYALYGYWGYSGQPKAISLGSGSPSPQYARLNAYGASLRTTVGSGLFNVETAYHQSLEATSPAHIAPPDQVLLLLGYESELVTNLTGSMQYYLEHTRNYGDYLASQPDPDKAVDQNRHLLTLRLGYRAWQDKLQLSLFTFYSPSDRDFYLKPQASYRVDDRWLLSAGLNLMNGRDNHTFFGQLDDNSNAWLRLRYHY